VPSESGDVAGRDIFESGDVAGRDIFASGDVAGRDIFASGGAAGHDIVAPVDEISAVSEADGLHAGLRRVLDATGAVPCSAAGLTLVPSGARGRVTRWQLPHADLGPDATITVLPHPFAATERLELVRVSPPMTGNSATDNGATDYGATDSGLADHTVALTAMLLAAVRVGLVARMARLAVAHLSSRESEGRPLIQRQLLHGVIADTIAALELCRHTLARYALTQVGAGITDVHAQLSKVGWSVTTLFGASGYLRDHPVRGLYVAELVHDAWVAPIADHPGEW